MNEIEGHRIAGIHVEPDGTLAAVWLAHNRDNDEALVYDTAVFRSETLMRIGEALNNRGRWIPIGWANKDVADALLDQYGCNMVPEGCKDDEALVEILSRHVWERLRAKRLRADRRLTDWAAEYKQLSEDEAAMGPLMTATRYALENLEYARAQNPAYGGGHKPLYPKVGIL